jgi:endonuclease/exonuclease/phosphatase family metal-dependent hydrolase
LFKEWKQSDAKNTLTAPANNPRSKIDYVLFRPANKWRVLETKVICNDKATDHCVVLSVLELINN